MRARRIGLYLLMACSIWGVALTAHAASSITLQRDGAISIAGRALRCGGVRNMLDRRLPNLGVAIPPRLLVMNPGLLRRQSETVQLFVFHHECGHHHVGGSELAADCWAVKQGVRDGWLDRPSLAQVCRSFGDGPATPTHPAPERRCAALERCFASATATIARQQRATSRVANSERHEPAAAGPQLTSGPTLVRSGWSPATR